MHALGSPGTSTHETSVQLGLHVETLTPGAGAVSVSVTCIVSLYSNLTVFSNLEEKMSLVV